MFASVIVGSVNRADALDVLSDWLQPDFPHLVSAQTMGAITASMEREPSDGLVADTRATSASSPLASAVTSATGRVSRAPRELSAARNCTRDEGGPFEFGDQEPISSHRKLLRAKAVVVSVAETPGQDLGRHGRERRAQANRR